MLYVMSTLNPKTIHAMFYFLSIENADMHLGGTAMSTNRRLPTASVSSSNPSSLCRRAQYSSWNAWQAKTNSQI